MSLSESYEECRQLNRHYGTKLHHTLHFLPKELQPHLHGLFAYDRILQEMLHNPKPGITKKAQAAAMMSWKKGLEADMKSDKASNHYFHAAIHTCKIFDLPIKRVSKMAQIRLAQQKKPGFDNRAQLQRHLNTVAQGYTDLLSPLLKIKHVSARRAVKRLMRNGELLSLLTYSGKNETRSICAFSRSEMKKVGYSKKDFEIQMITDGFKELVEQYLQEIETEAQAAIKHLRHLPEGVRHAFHSLAETQQQLVQTIRKKEYNLFSQPRLSLSLKLKHYIPAVGSFIRA